MPDIKTRDIAKGTIKTIDKSAVAAERMKSTFIQTKEKAEHSVDVPESSAEEYASNRLESGTDRVSHEAVHQFDKQGRKGVQATKQNIVKAKDGIQKFKEKRAAQSLQKQAQAATPRKGVGQGIKAVEQPKKAVKESVRSAGKKTIKTVGKGSAKTAQKTVKTAERTAKTTVKTAQRTAKAAQKTAQATAKGSKGAVPGARGGGPARRYYGESNRKSDSACGQGDYRRNKSVDRRNRRRRLDSGFGHYCDLPDRYASRISVRYLFLRRGFRHGYEYADRCAGNQYRIQYQTARGEKLGIL